MTADPLRPPDTDDEPWPIYPAPHRSRLVALLLAAWRWITRG